MFSQKWPYLFFEVLETDILIKSKSNRRRHTGHKEKRDTTSDGHVLTLKHTTDT